MANTDFLRFNAYSIRDLINRKLSEDSTFTDQIYSGSNLAVLVDIFSYMAQLLLYSLNNAASESMFADTQLYENINRLCNFIGYNPKGMSPASVVCKLSYISDSSEQLTRFIFPYSYINTGKTDSKGKPIYYTVPNSDAINNEWNGPYEIKTEDTPAYEYNKNITMYNGKWKLYSKIFVSDGNPWQTFVLDEVRSNAYTNDYVAHDFFDVYVVSKDGNNIYKFKQTSYQLFKDPFKINVQNEVMDNGFYNTKSFLYSGNLDDSGTIFNLKLNENKNYVISFGDGSTGAIPPKDSSIYIVYMETNGPEGIIDIGDINVNSMTIDTLNLKRDILEKIWFNGEINSENVFGSDSDDNIINITASTIPVLEENVDDIKSNAPNWFKMGNRLVTKSDYEYFIKTYPSFNSMVSDVVCMNNWEYISTFFKWLYDLGVKSDKNSRKYLNQNRLIKTNYKIADAADANNVYLWYVPSNINDESNRNADTVTTMMHNITNVIEPIKDLTHEPSVMPGIPVRFELCAADASLAKKWVQDGGSINFKSNNTETTYLEITLADDYIYSSSNIYSLIADIFSNYFATYNKLGSVINFGDIVTMISEIEGVNKIRTVYIPKDGSNPIIYNGISMASWTTDNNNLIDEGVDFELGISGRSLEKFQYAYFENSSLANLLNQIKILKTTSSVLNQVQY